MARAWRIGLLGAMDRWLQLQRLFLRPDRIVGGVAVPQYDVLLKGGVVVDPSQGIHRKMDVALAQGRVAAVRDEVRGGAREIIDVSDKLVLPGLIDFHTHVYWGGGSLGVDPDDLAVSSGATTLVDAGSAGAGNFLGLHRLILGSMRCRILAFLNVGFGGIFGIMGGSSPAMGLTSVSELCDLRLLNVGQAVETARQYPEEIVGIKIRAGIMPLPTPETIYAARKAAEEIGKPLMVHFAAPPPTIDRILPVLRAGDVLTHSFRGSPNSLLNAAGKLLPELREARARGVLLDIGHGNGSFSFDAAVKLLDQGVLPDIISSDAHAFSIHGPAFDLPTTMSKMLHLGMDLDEVIRAVTEKPAEALGRSGELGHLEEGKATDVSVMELVTGAFPFVDSSNKTLVGKRRFTPFLTVTRGQVVRRSSAPLSDSPGLTDGCAEEARH